LRNGVWVEEGVEKQAQCPQGREDRRASGTAAETLRGPHDRPTKWRGGEGGGAGKMEKKENEGGPQAGSGSWSRADTPGRGPRRKNERPRQYWTMVVARRMRASITCKHVFSSCGGDEKMMAVMLRPTGATGPRSTAHALGGSRQLFSCLYQVPPSDDGQPRRWRWVLGTVEEE